MNSSIGRSPSWVLADGSASISASALVAVLLNSFPSLAGLWGLGFLHGLTNKEDGVIIVASLLLFPSTFMIYGVARMIFAAKEAVEKKAMEKGRREGRQEGRLEGRLEGRQEGRQEGQEAERDRIERELAALEKNGINVPPEIARIIARESAPGS